ncbi:MAG TPA: methyltransferase domain-containing protein [Opitutaceae bacterium]|jgi:ubiquinone/menaquinone biosynthesis C-methylase UbiE|nr:methyltransferase domain-containing protein [Opitutaceae bacterium]
MNPSFDQIREQQKETWNRFSPGWGKWDAFTMRFLKPMGDAIIEDLRLKETDAVLDIATGTGEPGLTIARMVPKGSVIGTDLADAMLEIASARARSENRTNYSTKVGDVCALPFEDASFDAVSCRMGFMFFPDMALAAKEIARVLKPGGRFATSVWSAPDGNPWVTTMMAAVHHNIAMPAPAPGAPGMFRCAAPGLIAGFFGDAGMVGVSERMVTGKVTYESADHYWNMMMEVAAPAVAAMSGADEAARARVKADVYASLSKGGNPISLSFGSRIITGEKPA